MPNLNTFFVTIKLFCDLCSRSGCNWSCELLLQLSHY